MAYKFPNSSGLPPEHMDYQEGWQQRYRDKLDKELAHGIYVEKSDDFQIMTGKGGKIDIEVAFREVLFEMYDGYNELKKSWNS